MTLSHTGGSFSKSVTSNKVENRKSPKEVKVLTVES